MRFYAATVLRRKPKPLAVSRNATRCFCKDTTPQRVLETTKKLEQNPNYKAIYYWESIVGPNVLSMELIQASPTSPETKELFSYTKKHNGEVTSRRSFSLAPSIIDLKGQFSKLKKEYDAHTTTRIVPHSTSNLRMLCLGVSKPEGIDYEWFVLKPSSTPVQQSSLDAWHQIVMGNLSAWAGSTDDVFHWSLGKITNELGKKAASEL